MTGVVVVVGFGGNSTCDGNTNAYSDVLSSVVRCSLDEVSDDTDVSDAGDGGLSNEDGVVV